MSMNNNFCLVASLIASVLTASSSNASRVDEEHHKKYPYCGKMPNSAKTSQSKTTGRVVNSNYAEKDYRWVVLILRTNPNKNGEKETYDCSGSVITDRLGKEIHINLYLYTYLYSDLSPVIHYFKFLVF